MRIILAAFEKMGRGRLHTNSSSPHERPGHFGSACIKRSCIEGSQVTLSSDQTSVDDEKRIYRKLGRMRQQQLKPRKETGMNIYALEAGRRDEVTGSAGESFDVVQIVSRPCPV